MINTLYVAGSKSSFPGLEEQNINLDYVQNGMIALSAIQSGDFDSILVEDELPLMAPSRLIQELFKTNSSIPIIALVRSNKLRSNLDLINLHLLHTSIFEKSIELFISFTLE